MSAFHLSLTIRQPLHLRLYHGITVSSLPLHADSISVRQSWMFFNIKSNRTSVCGFWRFLSDVTECHTASLRRRIVQPSFLNAQWSVRNEVFTEYWTFQDEGCLVLRQTGNQSAMQRAVVVWVWTACLCKKRNVFIIYFQYAGDRVQRSPNILRHMTCKRVYCSYTYCNGRKTFGNLSIWQRERQPCLFPRHEGILRSGGITPFIVIFSIRWWMVSYTPWLLELRQNVTT